MNNFNDDLKFSYQAGDEEFWEKVYHKAFPNMVNSMPCPGNTISQRMGIDRIIHLSSGKTLAIDEKKRRKEWDDIALECVANATTKAPGWIEKDLAIDYMAYAFIESKRCYLFPWQQLRRAWLLCGDKWKSEYGIKEARNPNYVTLFVPVPTAKLLSAVAYASRIDV